MLFERPLVDRYIMFIDLGIPLAAIVILTPLQFWIAVTQMSNGNVISGKTLIPIGVGIVVFVALARVVCFMKRGAKMIQKTSRPS